MYFNLPQKSHLFCIHFTVIGLILIMNQKKTVLLFENKLMNIKEKHEQINSVSILKILGNFYCIP